MKTERKRIKRRYDNDVNLAKESNRRRKMGSVLYPGGVLVGERIISDRVMGGRGRRKGQSSSKLWGD